MESFICSNNTKKYWCGAGTVPNACGERFSLSEAENSIRKGGVVHLLKNITEMESMNGVKAGFMKGILFDLGN